MKKLLALLLLIPLAGSARMFPTEFPIKAVCWDSVDEAIEYHQDILGEHPIGKGWIDTKDDPSFAAIMYNPVKPSWTFLSFHQNEDAVVVCAITGGTQWEILSPGEDKIQL
jgi:hypothetical protein